MLSRSLPSHARGVLYHNMPLAQPWNMSQKSGFSRAHGSSAAAIPLDISETYLFFPSSPLECCYLLTFSLDSQPGGWLQFRHGPSRCHPTHLSSTASLPELGIRIYEALVAELPPHGDILDCIREDAKHVNDIVQVISMVAQSDEICDASFAGDGMIYRVSQYVTEFP